MYNLWVTPLPPLRISGCTPDSVARLVVPDVSKDHNALFRDKLYLF